MGVSWGSLAWQRLHGKWLETFPCSQSHHCHPCLLLSSSAFPEQDPCHWFQGSQTPTDFQKLFISHHACAQHHSVSRYPAGTVKTEKVWDTNLCFLDSAQPRPSAKGPSHRIFANKGIHSFLYLLSHSKGNMQQRLGHKSLHSCSFKWRIFLSVQAVFSFSLFMP